MNVHRVTRGLLASKLPMAPALIAAELSMNVQLLTIGLLPCRLAMPPPWPKMLEAASTNSPGKCNRRRSDAAVGIAQAPAVLLGGVLDEDAVANRRAAAHAADAAAVVLLPPLVMVNPSSTLAAVSPLLK